MRSYAREIGHITLREEVTHRNYRDTKRVVGGRLVPGWKKACVAAFSAYRSTGCSKSRRQCRCLHHRRVSRQKGTLKRKKSWWQRWWLAKYEKLRNKRKTKWPWWRRPGVGDWGGGAGRSGKLLLRFCSRQGNGYESKTCIMKLAHLGWPCTLYAFISPMLSLSQANRKRMRKAIYI